MAKYPDLKSYLQSNYKDLLSSEVQKFVDGNYDGGGFHSFNVLHTIFLYYVRSSKLLSVS